MADADNGGRFAAHRDLGSAIHLAGTMQLDFTESIGGDPAIFAGQA